MGTASYLYAITRDLDPDDLAGVPSLAGDPLGVVRHRDLSAVVSRVDAAHFGEHGLQRHPDSLDRLEAVARTHDTVVRAVAATRPTAPLRLATLYLDDDGVRRRLEEWYDDLVAVLDGVTGRFEWGVRAWVGPRTVDADGPDSDVLGAAGRLHEELSAAAVASRLLDTSSTAPGETRTAVLEAAYLVDQVAAQTFVDTVERHAAQRSRTGLAVEWEGPWPAYSFATLGQS